MKFSEEDILESRIESEPCGCFGKFKCRQHHRGSNQMQVVKCHGLWPMVSDACAVMPHQVKERLAACEKRGVPTEHTPLGQPIFRDRKHRKDFCERVAGQIDRNGGYSDPQKVRH